MEPVSFAEQNTIYAKDQPEYLALPAHCHRFDPQGRVTVCWRFTWPERLKLLVTGRLWYQTLTFGAPLQPQRPSVEKPLMLTDADSHDKDSGSATARRINLAQQRDDHRLELNGEIAVPTFTAQVPKFLRRAS